MALDRLTKIDGGGISTTSDYRVGVITATKFVGPFQGSSGNFSGVITATNGVFSGNISAVDGNFSGNVTIGGTLTYEDVTNIDSVGIITARNGINVSGGNVTIAKDLDVDGHTNLDNVSIAGITTTPDHINIDADDKALRIGDGQDIQIFHNSTTNAGRFANSSYIENNTGNFFIRGITGTIIGSTSGEIYAQFLKDDKCEFRFDNDIKLVTTNTGAKVTHSGAPTRLVVGSTDASGSWLVLDGARNGDGAGSDYAYIEHNASGHLNLINPIGGVALKGGGVNSVVCQEDAEVVIYHNGSRKFETLLTGAKVTGNLQVTGDLDVDGHTNLDNVSIAGVTTMTGNLSMGETLTVSGNNPNITFTDTNSNPDYKIYGSNGAFTILDSTNSVNRFAISSTGNISLSNDLDVNGDLDVDGHTDLDNVSIAGVVTATSFYGDGSNLTGITQTTINSNTNNYVVTATGTANTLQGEANLIYNGTGLGIGESSPANLLHVKVSDAGITPHSSAQIVLERDGTNYLQFLTTAAATSGILFGDTNDIDVGKLVYDHNLGDMQFQTEANVRMVLTGTGDLKLPDDGAIELGGSLTSGNGDLRIYHAASDNNSYIVEGGSGSLMIQGDIINIGNVGSSKYYIRAFEDGAVQLRYGNNLTKLATTETGIEVTGEVAATQDYPLVKPILNWNFAATKTLDPRIQFRRNGTGTFIDEKGIVQYAGNNKPRFDHHPTSGASLGLLLEKSSTNYQEYSTLMSEANNKNNITVTNNFAISPDGTQNASKIVNASSSNAQTNIGWNGSSVANGSYANWSIFVKSEETSCILQFFSNTYIFGHDRVNIELADGTYGGDAIDSTFRWIIEKYPNKWWRISVSGNGVGAAGGWYVGVVDSKSAARGATCGSATNKTWFAWGVQEEISTDRKFATSYIPTYGVSMNRGSDDAEVLGDDFDDFFDRYQGTVIHEFSNAYQYWAGGGSGWEFNNDNYQYNCITQISSGYSHNGYPGAYAVAHGESSDSGSNSMSLFGSSSSPGNKAHQNGYYAGRFPNNSTPDSARFYKTYTDGMSWDVSGSTNYIRTGSGGFSTTGTNTNVISYRNISKLAFGAGANDMDGSYQRFNGRIKNWMYYDKALSASQLATMTAQHPETYL